MVEFIAAGTGSELFELLAEILHQVPVANSRYHSQCSHTGITCSMKGDVKRHFSPTDWRRGGSRHPAFGVADREGASRGVPRSFMSASIDAVRRLKLRKRTWLSWQPDGSIGDSRSMALFGCPRGHSVITVTWCRSTHRRTSNWILTLDRRASEPSEPPRS